MKFLCVCLLVFIAGRQAFAAFGGDKVLLRDLNVLTLYQGKFTQGRRSSPIPQLQCVGGTAGCNSFVPKVVQCYNRGTDGYDVQWECKTDMDNAYRFGQVEVSCEGYQHPDDPYILKGSCGLEYTLDFTKEGQQQQQHHNYYGGQQHSSGYGGQQHSSGYGSDYHDRSYSQGFGSKTKSVLGDLIFLCIIGGVVYAIYKTCIAGSNHRNTSSDDGYHRHGNYGGYGQGPPPPGFRPDTYPDDCGSTYNSGYNQGYGYQRHAGGGYSGGGFWTGAATGGILGYLFGNRNSGYYGSRTHAPYSGSSWGHSYRSAPGSSFFGSSSSFGSGSFGTSSGASTGTRTASGFGGTKRR